MRTVLGLLVSRAPTTAVVLALFAQVALVQLWIEGQEVAQLAGIRPYQRTLT